MFSAPAKAHAKCLEQKKRLILEAIAEIAPDSLPAFFDLLESKARDYEVAIMADPEISPMGRGATWNVAALRAQYLRGDSEGPA